MRLIKKVTALDARGATELMPNTVDRDFSGASAWTNVDINAYDESTDLTITANAVGQYCTLPVASAPMTSGQKYRLYFDCANIVSTWSVRNFDGTQTIGTISANGTDQFIDFTASTTGGLRIVSLANNSSADLDNFSLVKIGYSEPINIQSYEFVSIVMTTADSANLTLKVQGGFGDTAYTPEDAASVSNTWDYIDIIDYEDGASVDGGTGVAWNGTDAVRQFSLNVDGIDWISFYISARSAGDVTVRVYGYNNQ